MSDEDFEDEPDGDGEGDGVELTPEQEESLRRMVERFRQSFAPKINLPTFKLPESTLSSFVAMPRMIQARQAMISNALKPVIEAQAAWQKQLSVINSDFFKTHALAQSNLNLIASQLTKNLSLGFGESAAKMAAQFTAQQAVWLKSIGPALASIRGAFYPPNLRAIEDLKFEEVEQVVMVDGIPLYGVPRTSVAEALIRADGAGKRRDILGRRWKTISTDCREAVGGCTSGAVVSFVPFVVAAINALDDGHTEAAQALAGSVVDSILSSYFGKDRARYTPDRKGKRTTDAYEEFTVRQFVAFAPIWQTYQQFLVADGDKVPSTFSRHATAHTVSPRQFNRRNAVQGIMLASSLLYRLNEEAVAIEADR